MCNIEQMFGLTSQWGHHTTGRNMAHYFLLLSFSLLSSLCTGDLGLAGDVVGEAGFDLVNVSF